MFSVLWTLMMILTYLYFPEDRPCSKPIKYWLKVRFMWLFSFYAVNIPLYLMEGPLYGTEKAQQLFIGKVMIYYVLGSIWLIYGLYILVF